MFNGRRSTIGVTSCSGLKDRQRRRARSCLI